MVDDNTTYVVIATSRCFSGNVLTNIANSIYLDQTDRIGSVGYVSTLIDRNYQLNGSA